ncbi:MAG TPA: hypothetical protein DCE42_21535 [Myxococcales bacterium]|nr:hypothetical protein [Myxococcales bacterium]|tara:strand:- start:3895 stop:4731 length:837 start_codon:yes stop_codon:yes gene_type:complete
MKQSLTHTKRILLSVLSVVLMTLCVSCGGEGTLTLHVWGEAFIEDAIPASEVEDEWKIEFTTFLIVVGNVSLASSSGEQGPEIQETKVFNLKTKGEQVFFQQSLPAGTWDRITYNVTPATSTTTAVGVSETQLDMMKTQGYSVYLEGKATKDGTTKTFAWGFKTSTTYKDCQSERAVVKAGGTASTQLTIHADHFFYDDLENPEAKVRFQVLADADTDQDGTITLEELAAVKGAAFAGLEHYGVGRFSQVTDLGAFVKHLSQTLGHIDGEGHCDVTLP